MPSISIQAAKCEPPFTSAGGHFNPDMKKHGLENPDGPHAGDMKNFTVKPNGTAKTTVMDERVNLDDDAHSVFANGGTALMIHEKADDMKSDPGRKRGRAHRLRRDHEVASPLQSNN